MGMWELWCEYLAGNYVRAGFVVTSFIHSYAIIFFDRSKCVGGAVYVVQ